MGFRAGGAVAGGVCGFGAGVERGFRGWGGISGGGGEDWGGCGEGWGGDGLMEGGVNYVIGS